MESIFNRIKKSNPGPSDLHTLAPIQRKKKLKLVRRKER